jgi:hypothetical protein
MEMNVNRAQFLRRGAAGGLALVAGNSALALVRGPAPAFGQTVTDPDIAKLAATAELLAIDFYTHAIASGKFKGDDLRYLRQARVNEHDHYDALAKVLGSAAPKGLKFKYPSGTFSTRLHVARTGVALETAFVGAYLGAVTALSDNGLKGVAAQIAASESQHLSVFSDIASGKPVGASFPKAFTAAQATTAVTPFLA